MGIDIIRLLPESVANQIAAGEVVQRPASVVKELMENAVDAGATSISIEIKDAGRTLIRVTDNGCGMSLTDARMAFERHATSKISAANDLFALQTMGFRGEALPSIVAVSQVELKTCREGENLGTHLVFNGSDLEKQEPINTPKGSCFSVRNLFFNVPVRRKFLKSNQTELSRIMEEFERVALANPKIAMSITNNESEIYSLNASSVYQRIVSIFGKRMKEVLIPVKIESTILNLKGYVSSPLGCIRKNQKQFFFVNGRYMKHPYFHKAVLQPYDGLIQTGEEPHYFLYFDVDPSTIDVNIHPTKTQISFENAIPIWQMISASVKEALGRNNAVPSIDFNTEGAIEIPPFKEEKTPPPSIHIDNSYNPFKVSKPHFFQSSSTRNWEQLYASQREPIQEKPLTLEDEGTSPKSKIISLGNRYMLSYSHSGLMIVHIRRANVRVLYDRYLRQMEQKKECSQRILFPETLTFSASDCVLLDSVIDELFYMGFEINSLKGGTYSINGIPSGLPPTRLQEMLDRILEDLRTKNLSLREDLHKRLSLSLAEWGANCSDETPTEEKLTFLLEQLMASSDPYHTPNGKKILTLLSEEDIEKFF